MRVILVAAPVPCGIERCERRGQEKRRHDGAEADSGKQDVPWMV